MKNIVLEMEKLRTEKFLKNKKVSVDGSDKFYASLKENYLRFLVERFVVVVDSKMNEH